MQNGFAESSVPEMVALELHRRGKPSSSSLGLPPRLPPLILPSSLCGPPPRPAPITAAHTHTARGGRAACRGPSSLRRPRNLRGEAPTAISAPVILPLARAGCPNSRCLAQTGPASFSCKHELGSRESHNDCSWRGRRTSLAPGRACCLCLPQPQVLLGLCQRELA